MGRDSSLSEIEVESCSARLLKSDGHAIFDVNAALVKKASG